MLPEALCEVWLDAFEASTLRLPGRVDRTAWRAACRAVAEAYCDLPSDTPLAPGAGLLRELEKRVTFLGGALADPALGASPFEVSALILALRQAAPSTSPALFDWLLACAHAGFAASQKDVQTLAFREVLERSTPVVVIPGATSDVPALLLVGAPDRGVLDSLLGRLLLAVVRTGARSAIIDATGAAAPGSEACLAALGRLAAHPYASSRPLRMVCAGVPEACKPSWQLALAAPTSVTPRPGAGGLTSVFAADFAEAISVGSRE